jgi:hypothetical protein
MKRPVIASAAVLTALSVPASAGAQTGGGIDLGGTVNSSVELLLTQPAKGFASFTRAKAYQLRLDAGAITTDGRAQLMISDGDADRGSRHGHLTVGHKRLRSPLEATIGSAAFQPLDSATDPLLKRWSGPVSRSMQHIKLRQRLPGRATGSYRKLVLVTLSTETP